MKKSKTNPLDYKSWGVEKYGYTLWLNQPFGICSFIFQHNCFILDVENYKDGSFAGLGVLVPHQKDLYFWNDRTLLPSCVFQDKMLIGHVVRTDVHKLRQWGFKLNPRTIHYDTALIEHLTNSTKKEYGLKPLVKEKFGIEYPTYAQVVGDGDFDKVPLEVISNYNGMDLIATYELWKSQNQELANTDIYKNLLWPLGEVLSSMEERGLQLDMNYMRRLEGLFSAQKAEIEKQIFNELGTINLNSPKQVLEALRGKGIVPKYKGKESIDKRGLRNMESTPLISQLLGFSELETLLSSFITPLLEQGQLNASTIHPFYSQTATRTGRLACYRPNVQQIPTHTENGKKVKRGFIPRPGYKFVELDYSAIEPRMLAHFSKSVQLSQLFKSGINFHDFTAKRLSVDRQVAKVLNLSTGYRATKYALAFQLKCSVEEAERHLNEWWALWPDLYLWEQNLISVTKQKGYIETLLGRKIYIDGLDSNERKTREKAERRVIENLAQGSTADLIGKAMIYLHNRGFKIVNQIHDAVLLELDDLKYISRARNIMENVLHLEVPTPVEVKIGDTWGEMIKHA